MPLLRLLLILPTLISAPCWADEDPKAALNKRIGSVKDSPSTTKSPAAPPLQTTVAPKDAVSYPAPQPEKDAWGTVSKNLWNPVTGGIVATYAVVQWRANYNARLTRQAARAVQNQLQRAFPRGLDGRLAPQLRQVQAAEIRLAQHIAQIQDPKAKRYFLDKYGKEVCAKHLANLMRGRVNADVAEAPKWGTPEESDRALIAQIEAEDRNLQKAYQDWFEEIQKIEPEFARLTGQSLRLPPRPESLAADTVADTRAIRQAMEDLERHFSSMVKHFDTLAQRTSVERARDGISEMVAEGVAPVLWRTGANMAAALRAGLRHPIRTATQSIHNSLTNPAPLLKAAPPVVALVSILAINGYIQHRESELKQKHQTTIEEIAEGQRASEQAATPALRKFNDQMLATALASTWKALVDKKEIEAQRSRLPILIQEESAMPDLSPAALQNIRNFAAEGAQVAKDLGITETAGIWVVLYRQMDPNAAKPSYTEIYKTHQEEIQKLAVGLEGFAENASEILSTSKAIVDEFNRRNAEDLKKAAAEKTKAQTPTAPMPPKAPE